MRRTQSVRLRVQIQMSLRSSTWIQTCAFARRGEPPSEPEQAALVDFLRARLAEGVKLQGILLYSLARESHQPEASELAPGTEFELHAKGGHVGFVEGSPRRPGYYLERRIPQWLDNRG